MQEKRIDEYIKRENALEENIRKTYQIVWDMCTDAMKAKLKAVSGFEAMEKELKVLDLLEEMRKITYNFEERRYTQHNMFMAWKKFYDMKQEPEETDQEWYDRFNRQI